MARWKEIADSGYIRNYVPNGNTLYDIEIMVDPEFRRLKLARRQNVAIFLILSLSVICTLAGVAALLGESGSNVIVILVAILYICIDLFMAASSALFVDITDPKIGATQFGAFVSATDGCDSWSSFVEGKLPI